jgi:uncharacterized protein
MRYFVAFSLFLLASLCVAPNTTAQTADPAGHWQGAITLPNNAELGIAVTLESRGDAGWAGSIDIPAQSLQGFALSNVTVQEGRVHFEMNGIPGQPTFAGQLAEAGEAITGTFQQGAASLPFALRRADDATAAPASPSLPAQPVPGEGAVGEWLGVLDVGSIQLRLVLKIEAAEGGGLTAILNSVDQGAKIPVDTITLQERALHLNIDRVQANFKGTLNEDGSAMEGTWSQGAQSLPLAFHRTAEPFALNRPQNPEPPFPYDSRDVTFPNTAGAITLAGTLLTPRGEGPFPAVVLVTGSGAQDRDESLMGHKPFLVLADHLARHGIASLRYDDRGAGESEGDHMGSTVGDFSTDAAAAVAFLAAQPKIDGEALGIVGHSEGGLTGPRVATEHRGLAFLVLLAPPGEPLDALLARQGRDVLRQRGISAALIERALAAQAEEIELIQDASLDTETLTAKLQALATAAREGFTAAEREQLQLTDAALEQGLRVSTSPWFRSLVREDPAVYLKQLKIPVLALFGGKDIQVAPEVNAGIVKASLSAAGNQDFEVHILPGLNHLFQHAETGAVAEYGTIEETFAPEALEKISGWIRARFAGS